MISFVEPVSPTRGKTFLTLYWCASSRTSVMASRARVTLNPCSVSLAGGRLNAAGGGHSSDNNVGNASRLELVFKICGCEGAPASLGDQQIVRLLVELRQKVRPALGKGWIAARTLLRPARRTACHIDQHDWKILRPENIEQCARAADNIADGMHEVSIDDAPSAGR